MSEPGNQELAIVASAPQEALGEGVHKYEVGQNAYQLLDIPSTDRDTHVVQTVARIGCDAVLAWRMDPTGVDHLLMTHYDPGHINDHIQVLRDNFPQGEGEIRAILLMAGKTTADRNKGITDYLEQATGKSPDVVIAGDDVTSSEAIKRFMTEDPIAYQLIFTRGYNGKPQVRRIIVPLEQRRGSNEDAGYAYEKVFDPSQSNI